MGQIQLRSYATCIKFLAGGASHPTVPYHKSLRVLIQRDVGSCLLFRKVPSEHFAYFPPIASRLDVVGVCATVLKLNAHTSTRPKTMQQRGVMSFGEYCNYSNYIPFPVTRQALSRTSSP
jgi:hypothetical protein